MSMGKSTNTGFASSTQSDFHQSHSSWVGIFFDKKSSVALLLAWLTACGGWSDSTSSSSSNNTGNDQSSTNTSWVPIASIPTNATAIIELGPISGWSVIFKTLNASTLATWWTNNDGSLNYNPRDIVSKIGKDQWIVAHVSGWIDTDADDNGLVDTIWTPINGSFRMLISRSSLENGEKIIVNPRAWAVSDGILSRVSPTISNENLDHIARQTGAEDQNNDGIVNYRDLTAIQMRDVTWVSQIVPAVSGYIGSVHSWSVTQKETSLSNIAKTENHITPIIVANPYTTDHTPALKLKTVSPATILYTLDGSNPTPSNPKVRSANSELVIPFQNAKLSYREQFTLNGKSVLGKVTVFNLLSDWTELVQSSATYNSNSKSSTWVENFAYRNTSYTITSNSNAISTGYTYPKTIDCHIWNKITDGCQYWPYIAWSPDHESRIRELIIVAAKSFIDTTSVILPPPNLVDIIRNSISYKWSTYTITNTYTLDTVNNARTFPVVASVDIYLKNWQTYKYANKANNQTELNALNTQIEKDAKTYIDNNTLPPNLVDIIRNSISYKWSTYTITNTYTLDTVNNARTFPVVIVATVVLKSGEIFPLTNKAKDQSELDFLNAQLEQKARSFIDTSTASADSIFPQYNSYASLFDNATFRNIFSWMNSKIIKILPISSAYAQTAPGWWIKVQSSRTKLPPFAPVNATTVAGKFLWNSSLVDHYVKNTVGKASVWGGNLDQAELRSVISQIQFSVDKIKDIRAQCSGAGTTLPSPISNWCILTPTQQTQIRGYEDKIFEQIGNYLKFGWWLSVWAGAAVYEELMWIGSDVMELADGTILKEFENNLWSLKSTISTYIVNWQIDYNKIKNSLVTGTSAIEQEIWVVISALPWAVATLDAYYAWYYTWLIWWGIVLEFVNPSKKLKLITSGLSVGRWLDRAKALIVAKKYGVDGLKMMNKIESVYSLASSKLWVYAKEFTQRMWRMDEYMLNEYLNNPDKYIDAYRKNGKYNMLKEPWLKWRKDIVLFKNWKFTDNNGITLNDIGWVDYVIQNWEMKYGFWHSFIAEWKNVDYAWTIGFQNWIPIKLTNSSWHYQPDPLGKQSVIDVIQKSYNFDASKIPFIWVTN
jgi:hypothetical protein